MQAILERPHGYTMRELAEMYGVSKDTIKHDFEAFSNAGLVLQYDRQYRYAFVEEKSYQQLKTLLHFSAEEQTMLEEAIDHISDHSRMGKRLKRKLGSLYDFRRLGHSYLRKPYLTKVDQLLEAQNQQRQAILVDYPSGNSNQIRDRLVEPFHTSPPDDMVHAFDVEKQELRHFRISRVKRVRITEASWQYENHHQVLPTDPFRIVDSQQVMVHLRMSVGAKNELIERFPLAKGYIEEAGEEEIFDLQCMVNHRFLGLSNFILGNYHFTIEVLSPDSLMDHLHKTIRNMNFS